MDQHDVDNNNNQVYSRLSKAVISSGQNYVTDPEITNTMFFRSGPSLVFGDEMIRCERTRDKDSDELIKTQIANHPSYPHLLTAYIQCQKIGAPPETASFLEEMDRESNMMTCSNSRSTTTTTTTGLGPDHELDYFMESYREVLMKFNEELCKPFNEATMFLKKIESQLSKLCDETFTESTGQSPLSEIDHEDENEMKVMSYGDQVKYDHGQVGIMEGYGVGGTSDCHEELKEKLLRKYGGYLTTLKTEFLKKRKKVELPKSARTTLLRWWNSHYRWPYPSEEEKAKLSEESGLDQRQINNWFVNQRKRHWKPSEDIKSALVDDLSPAKSPALNL